MQNLQQQLLKNLAQLLKKLLKFKEFRKIQFHLKAKWGMKKIAKLEILFQMKMRFLHKILQCKICLKNN